MKFLILLTIAVSLSMDAFSLSLAYGTLNLKKNQIFNLSTIVGIYHFFMPLLGMLVGEVLLNFIPIKPDIVVFVVLFFIGIQMIVESFKKEEKIEALSNVEMFLFGLAVSIDSFSLGIGLNTITTNFLLSSTIFSVSAFIFTYLGLALGKKISEMIGKVATFLGGITLIVITFIYLFGL